jgi:2-dehydro-3-deoxygalactonokinase
MSAGQTFYSCDWGTTHFRLRLVGPDGVVRGEVANAEGVKAIAGRTPLPEREAAFAAVLRAARAQLGGAPAPVVVSGMAGSRLGWRELPYAPLPLALDRPQWLATTLRIDDDEVHLLSGCATDSDVMRGEETELVGLSRGPSWPTGETDCLVVLPGTHSKHVVVRERAVVSFTTFLTGEAYALLVRQSTLAAPDADEPDEAAFTRGVETVRRLGLAAALFQARSQVLLGHLEARQGGSFLSGLLIGAELATTLDRLPTTPMVVAAGPALARPYARALEVLGAANFRFLSPDDVALAVVRGQREFLRQRPTAG